MSAGCQRGTYRASKLPAELQAPPNISALSLDLSRIGNSTSSNEIVQRGDLLEVAMATGLEQNQEELTQWPLRVADDGSVTVPLVGQVYLAGLPLTHADHMIRRASIERGIYRNPNVSVRVAKARTNKISVIGAVDEPGTYELPIASSDCLSAIAAAGGLTEDAGTTIEIRHPPRVVSRPAGPNGNAENAVTTAAFRGEAGHASARSQQIDLVSATAGEPGDYGLEDGSVVMVKKRPLRAVYVGGLVRKPGQYEMPVDTDLYLLEAISMAEGRTLEIADQITVLRRMPGESEPIVIKASVRKANKNGLANLKLAPGDVVNVDETPTTFMVQTLKDFVRFGFSSGLPGF
jgi:polysaccharide export outer membrane protein